MNERRRRRWLGIHRWLSRGKLWDDVFTRLVANVITLLLVAAFAALAGLIKIRPRFWFALLVMSLTVGALYWISTAGPEREPAAMRRIRLSVLGLAVMMGLLLTSVWSQYH